MVLELIMYLNKMSLKGHNSGFTLIELLVVIAIIGLLSSVVLASLASARNRAADGSIRQNLSQVMRGASIYYDTYGSYAPGASFTDASDVAAACASLAGGTNDNFLTPNASIASAVQIITSIRAAGNASNGGGLARATCRITDGPTSAYAISVPLKTDAALHWCVDSTGVSKIRNSALSGAGVTC